MQDCFFHTCEKRTENLRVEKLLLAGCEPAAKRAFEVSIQVGWKGRWSRLDKVHTCASRHGYLGALGMTSSLASAPRGARACFQSEKCRTRPSSSEVHVSGPLGRRLFLKVIDRWLQNTHQLVSDAQGSVLWCSCGFGSGGGSVAACLHSSPSS